MTKSNAERQADWRARRQARLNDLDDDFKWYLKASKPILDAFKAEGAKKTSDASKIASLTLFLDHLNQRWLHLPPQQRKTLSGATTVPSIGGMLPYDNFFNPAVTLAPLTNHVT